MSARIEPQTSGISPQKVDSHSTDNDAVSRNIILDGSPIVALGPLASGEELDSPVCFSLCLMSKAIFSIKLIMEEVVEDDVQKQSLARARVEQLVRFNVS